jgi:uncharacterized protein (DUF2252 family)
MPDILDRVLDFNKDISPELLKYKLKIISESLFRFFRGTNHLFCEDLKTGLPESPTCWITGDLHVENFGSYKSNNRLVYFDLNDFDDALLAPVCYDLLRMAASIFVAFDTLEISQKKAFNMAKLYLTTYADTLAGGKPDYIEPRTAKGVVAKFLTTVEKRKVKDILDRKTILKKGKVQLITGNNKHYKLEPALKKELILHMQQWLKTDNHSPYNYKIKDAVFRRAGTGSIGAKRYALLLKSSNDTGEKYLIVEMKEAKPSCVQKYVPVIQPAWKSEADRVVTIQRRMENKLPALLSTTVFRNEAYIVEEMQPTQDQIKFELIKNDYRDIYQVINDMAVLTASAHLRSSGMSGSSITDELIDFGKDEGWLKDILELAIECARKSRDNFDAYLKDYQSYVSMRKKVATSD